MGVSLDEKLPHLRNPEMVARGRLSHYSPGTDSGAVRLQSDSVASAILGAALRPPVMPWGDHAVHRHATGAGRAQVRWGLALLAVPVALRRADRDHVSHGRCLADRG